MYIPVDGYISTYLSKQMSDIHFLVNDAFCKQFYVSTKHCGLVSSCTSSLFNRTREHLQ